MRQVGLRPFAPKLEPQLDQSRQSLDTRIFFQEQNPIDDPDCGLNHAILLKIAIDLSGVPDEADTPQKGNRGDHGRS